MTVVSRLRKDAALWTRARAHARRGGAAGRGSTAPTGSAWPSGPASGAGWTTEHVRALRRVDGQAVQDVPGDLAAGRRRDPGGAGGRADRLGGVLLHRPVGEVADILTTVADRFSLEITFRDCKEVVGAGQQQVRFVWANIGAFHVCLWTFTMTEAWAWSRAAERVGGPLGLAVGHADTPSEPRGQAAGVASRVAGRGDSSGSTPRGHRGGNSGRAERLLSLAA